MMPKQMTFAHLATILSTFDLNISSIEGQLAAGSTYAQLTNDSREINAGDVFCAIDGENQHGRQYIEQVIESGCALILAECKTAAEHGDISFSTYITESAATSTRENPRRKNIAIIEFYQLNQQLFEVAKRYYQAPQNDMDIIGITGTNGKTTTCQLLAQLIDATGEQAAVIGTNGAGRLSHLLPIKNTTPGATELHQLFDRFKQQHINYTVMEVSSHALVQRRVLSDLFDIAIYTNLSRDHLDYHGDMASYAAAKHLIFSENADQIAVINTDDEIGRQWASKLNKLQTLIVYGRDVNLCKQAYFVGAENIVHHANGLSFTLITHLGDIAVTSPLMGDFNVDNLLASIAALMALALKDKNKPGVDLMTLAENILSLKAIKGRMELFSQDSTGKDNISKSAVVVVDYAHTPDALENALIACKQHCQGQLWVVFGCGGDRDQGKRPLMGTIAERLADHVILTTDNPRNESSENIIKNILAGCKKPENIDTIVDRKEAVLTTLKKAGKNDVVLLAGKGHENTITLKNNIVNYDERAVVADYMAVTTNRVYS